MIRELQRQTTVWRGLGDVPLNWPACAVTIGVFDGVHRGHTWLIEHTLRAAREQDLPAVLVTFDPHPAHVLGLQRDTARLSTIDRRADIACELGVDAVCVLPFTAELARMSPAEFVEQILVATLHAATVVVGANFTFGHRGAGDVNTLAQLGDRHGFSTRIASLLPVGETKCSSTYIRDCLQRGDIRAANRALGRPHETKGILTANLEVMVPDGTALPRPGHYSGNLADHRPVGLEVVRPSGASVHTLRLEAPAPAIAPGDSVRVQFLD